MATPGFSSNRACAAPVLAAIGPAHIRWSAASRAASPAPERIVSGVSSQQQGGSRASQTILAETFDLSTRLLESSYLSILTK